MDDRGATRKPTRRLSGRDLLLLQAFILFFFGASWLTSRSFLRLRFLDVNEPALAVTSIAWLVVFVVATWKSRRRPQGSFARTLETIRYGLIMLLFATAFACLSVVAVDLTMLLAVRYGPSEPVEFRSQVTHTGHTRGCSRTFAFANHPLGRETSLCGADLPLFLPKAGDRIVVRQQVGALGGTVTLVKKDWSAE